MTDTTWTSRRQRHRSPRSCARGARDHRPLPGGPGALGAAAAAAPGAVRGGLRLAGRASRSAPSMLGLTKAQVGAVATFYTMYKRRRPATAWSASAPTRCATCSAASEVYDDARRAPRRRARRDHRRRQDHAGARRVPGRLRLRPGDDGQLRLLRPGRRRDARSTWSTRAAGTASGRSRPAARGSARSRRWRCSSPASPTSATARSPTAWPATPTLRGMRLAAAARHRGRRLRPEHPDRRRSRRRRPAK